MSDKHVRNLVFVSAEHTKLRPQMRRRKRGEATKEFDVAPSHAIPSLMFAVVATIAIIVSTSSMITFACGETTCGAGEGTSPESSNQLCTSGASCSSSGTTCSSQTTPSGGTTCSGGTTGSSQTTPSGGTTCSGGTTGSSQTTPSGGTTCSTNSSPSAASVSPPPCKMELQKQLIDQIVSVGGTVTLSVEVQIVFTGAGAALPSNDLTAAWMKAGVQIEASSTRFKMTSDVNTFMLAISESVAADAGEYEVQITSQTLKQTTTSKCSVTVLATTNTPSTPTTPTQPTTSPSCAMQFQLQLQNESVYVGAAVTLSVKLKIVGSGSSPIPSNDLTVVWSKDDFQISTSSKYTLSQNLGTFTLSISASVSDDAGDYKVQITSQTLKQTITSTCSVTVLATSSPLSNSSTPTTPTSATSPVTLSSLLSPQTASTCISSQTPPTMASSPMTPTSPITATTPPAAGLLPLSSPPSVPARGAGNLRIVSQMSNIIVMTAVDTITLFVKVGLVNGGTALPGDLTAVWSYAGIEVKASSTVTITASSGTFSLQIASASEAYSGQFTVTITSNSMSATISSTGSVTVVAQSTDIIAWSVLQQENLSISYTIASQMMCLDSMPQCPPPSEYCDPKRFNYRIYKDLAIAKCCSSCQIFSKTTIKSFIDNPVTIIEQTLLVRVYMYVKYRSQFDAKYPKGIDLASIESRAN